MCLTTSLFDLAVEDILDEVGANLLKNNPEYRNLADQSIEIGQKLIKVLAPEMRSVFDEYENIQLRMQDIAMSNLYKLGLANGISLRTNVEKIAPAVVPFVGKNDSADSNE